MITTSDKFDLNYVHRVFFRPQSFCNLKAKLFFDMQTKVKTWVLVSSLQKYDQKLNGYALFTVSSYRYVHEMQIESTNSNSTDNHLVGSKKRSQYNFKHFFKVVNLQVDQNVSVSQ